MDLFVNDLSFHGQFSTTQAFREAFEGLMAMRAVALRHDRDLYCRRMFASAQPVPGITMQQALNGLRMDERRAALSWMTRGGPFWDDSDLRRHSPDDYLECNDEIVTESAVGEAAYRVMHRVECGLVSVVPSDWLYSPVEVVLRREAEGLDDETASVENWWSADALGGRLQAAEPPLASWNDLRDAATRRFPNLTFAGNCFHPLVGLPFAPGAADHFIMLFDTLERLSQAFDSAGRRTAEARQIYRDHFTGKDSWFSDSSDSEKSEFRKKLTFPHPDAPGKRLFCPWHGKVRHMTLRLHYWWSGKSGEPVYVVYAGQKLTKR